MAAASGRVEFRAARARDVALVRLATSSVSDKVNLDFFWLKDERLEDSVDLPDPDIIAAEIADDLQAALAQFAEIANDLKK